MCSGLASTFLGANSERDVYNRDWTTSLPRH